ncbi:hypothetical protein BaRGS_00000605, partial [Batillaria attramentaria]
KLRARPPHAAVTTAIYVTNVSPGRSKAKKSLNAPTCRERVSACVVCTTVSLVIETRSSARVGALLARFPCPQGPPRSPSASSSPSGRVSPCRRKAVTPDYVFCRSQPSSGSITLLSVGLGVSVARGLRITSPPRSQTVLNNKRLKLPCKAQGGDLPITIKWFHNGSELFKLGENYRISDRTGALRFTQVKVSNRGAYQCKAKNGFEEVYSNPIHLTVHAEAEIIHPMQPQLSVYFGMEATLICEAVGIPMPTIQWRKDGVSITEPDYGLHGVLRVEEKLPTAISRRSVLYINATTSAEFECEAVNKHVEGITVVSRKYHLTVKPPLGK